MGETLIERACDLCGRPIKVRPRAMKRGWGRFHKRCAQITRTMGAKNPNFEGGRAYHSTRISRARRSQIKARDGHRCVHCGRAGRESDAQNGVQLDVHHVIAVRDGGADQDDNLVSLCRKCHNNIEHGREKLIWPRHTRNSPPPAPSKPNACDPCSWSCGPTCPTCTPPSDATGATSHSGE